MDDSQEEACNYCAVSSQQTDSCLHAEPQRNRKVKDLPSAQSFRSWFQGVMATAEPAFAHSQVLLSSLARRTFASNYLIKAFEILI